MSLFNLNRDIPWFFQYLENYYHIFLNMRFNYKEMHINDIEFSVELNLQGFEGLIFYFYKSKSRKLIFNLFRHSLDKLYQISGLSYDLTEYQSNPLDFIIIPFGYFKEQHKFNISVQSDTKALNYDVFSWSPSHLFKNVKSVIKLDNQYNELIPIDDIKGYYFQLPASFKGNQTNRLFDLINLIVDLLKTRDEISNQPLFEPMDLEIKSLVSKSNEFLFELCQTSVPLEIKSVIRELERLKFNIESLTKEEIFNWLDDIIDFYSQKS